MNNQWFSKVAVWLVIALVLFTVFKQFDRTATAGNQIGYSEFLEEVRAKRIREVVLQENPGGAEIEALTTDDKRIRTTATYLDRGLVGDLINNGIKFRVKPRDEPSLLTSLLVSWGPMLLLIGVWVYFMRQMQGGGKGGAFSFGKSRARMLDDTNNSVTFADVAGCDEAKEEVKELVDFLKDPQKFQKLGGRIPRGVLMVGPPGTGKTLLARAVAGEANVAFLSISGSDFVELYVGVGASRVRDLFDQAKRVAPAIVFIDEIDAVGRQRGAGLGGGHDEREQTLNQLLVEMDGFSANEGVIVIAATNRKDILDPALLRPGRFDRQIYVGAPDWRGRAEILQVHARKKPLADNVDLPAIAKATAGFTGADLANLLNEGALLAARNGKAAITQQDLEAAMIKVIAGPEKKSRVVSHSEKMLTAVHEAGHAVCMYCLDSQDPVHLITIIPRAQAGGMTISLPQDDKSYASRNEMFETVVSFLGGRVAEALKLCDISTGASNDLQRATKLARDMVATYGMSDAIGPVSYSSSQEVFIGRDYEKTKPYSEATAGEIDVQVQSIMREAYKRCEEILTAHSERLDKIAGFLMENENMNRAQFEAVMQDEALDAPKS